MREPGAVYREGKDRARSCFCVFVYEETLRLSTTRVTQGRDSMVVGCGGLRFLMMPRMLDRERATRLLSTTAVLLGMEKRCAQPEALRHRRPVKNLAGG